MTNKVEDFEIVNRNIPEAGGIAWVTMYTTRGAAINMTARAENLVNALDDLIHAMIYAQQKYNMDIHPVIQEAGSNDKQIEPVESQNTPSVQNAQVKTSNTLTPYEVVTFFVDIDTKGEKHLKVRCGQWVKFGLYAYKPVLPEDVRDEFESWDLKTDFIPPESMKYALVDESGPKPRIRKFLSEISQ